jgi:hypothetical protein
MTIINLFKKAKRWRVLAGMIGQPRSHVGFGRRRCCGCRVYKRKGGSRLRSVGKFLYKHRGKIATGAMLASMAMKDASKNRGIVNAMSNYV